MSLPVRTWKDLTPQDYAYVTTNVEAMTDREIAQELGVSLTAVQRMRSELGLRRKDRNGMFGKITSPGIEPIDTFERRMKDRLKEEGITGDEARMFMRSFLLDRAKDIERCEYRMRLNTNGFDREKEYYAKMGRLKAECYFKLNSYDQ